MEVATTLMIELYNVGRVSFFSGSSQSTRVQTLRLAVPIKPVFIGMLGKLVLFTAKRAYSPFSKKIPYLQVLQWGKF